jgi:uncharacterized protein
MTEFTPWAALLGGALIGLSAVLLMAVSGRIAGISGIVVRLLPPVTDKDWVERLAFVVGLVVAAPLLGLAGVDFARTVSAGPALLVGAGLLVGFGAVYGNGCTSGHGVCGLARLSMRSLVATGVFMSTAVAAVFVLRHVLGG